MIDKVPPPPPTSGASYSQGAQDGDVYDELATVMGDMSDVTDLTDLEQMQNFLDQNSETAEQMNFLSEYKFPAGDTGDQARLNSICSQYNTLQEQLQESPPIFPTLSQWTQLTSDISFLAGRVSD